MIDLDLNTNELEALLRHARSFKSETGDPWEDSRLNGALEALADALDAYLKKEEGFDPEAFKKGL